MRADEPGDRLYPTNSGTADPISPGCSRNFGVEAEISARAAYWGILFIGFWIHRILREFKTKTQTGTKTRCAGHQAASSKAKTELRTKASSRARAWARGCAAARMRAVVPCLRAVLRLARLSPAPRASARRACRSCTPTLWYRSASRGEVVLAEARHHAARRAGGRGVHVHTLANPKT